MSDRNTFSSDAAAPVRPPLPPHSDLVSPEVLPDNQVTFRIYAPKASEVLLDGDWVPQGRGTGGPLQKDDQGVWSITVGPLVPDFYMYTLTVDGVPTIDPQNRAIKQGIAPLKNVFLVPGEEAAFAETRPVPHGDVRRLWYDSPTLGSARSMRVSRVYRSPARQYRKNTTAQAPQIPSIVA